ncbi:hypothetical protein KQI52_14100 [bacterium]|nr:hypothetical protein [bacterium]
MGLHTSGEVMAAAREQGVIEERLPDFVRRFHMKMQYMGPEAAFKQCMREDKNITYGNHYGQIPPRQVLGSGA